MKPQVRFRKIGFVLKKKEPEALRVALPLMEWLKSQGCALYVDSDSRSTVSGILRKSPSRSPLKMRIVSKSELVSGCDLILVLGGDGTFLSVARLMSKKSIPLLGINLGHLGFLTEVKKTEALSVLKQVISGKMVPVRERILLQVSIFRGKRSIYQGLVANDVVVSKGTIGKVIGVEVSVDGKKANALRADGLIISTPMGSTAYSLSAGGPVIIEGLKALVITPICPHSLMQRPMVVSNDANIQIRLTHRPGDTFLTLDGKEDVRLALGDVIEIRKFKKHSLKVLTVPGRNYFDLLREKFNFGSTRN